MFVFVFFFNHSLLIFFFFFFFFNDTATTEIYTLSLHDALPICLHQPYARVRPRAPLTRQRGRSEEHTSELHHLGISYAVFCLKKKKEKHKDIFMKTKTKKKNNIEFKRNS